MKDNLIVPPANTDSKLRKKQEISLVILFFGVVLLISPLVNAFTFNDGGNTYGRTGFYIFGIWAVLNLASWIISVWLLHDTLQADKED